MRGLLGLAGLASILIVTFIIVYMWADYTQKSTPAMKQITGQANQLAGRSSAGVPIGGQGTPVLADSKFAPVERNGKLVGLTVVCAARGTTRDNALAMRSRLARRGAITAP